MNLVVKMSDKNECVSESLLSDSTAVVSDKRIMQKIITSSVSILPWLMVFSLLAAGIFIKPTAHVEEVIPPAIEKRDKIYGLYSLYSGH
jgi:hypothetical protein